MQNEKFLTEINDIVEPYNLTRPNEEKSLRHNRFTIYLCGMSGNGKTTFMNAILGLKRNEFPERTNVSTKTKFILNYSNDYCIKKSNDEKFEKVPESFEERQKLYNEINNSGIIAEITLPCNLLNGKTIIDIPGLFDYENKNLFLQDMISEADLVIFFKHFKNRITPDEKTITDKLTAIGLPYILLLTYIDTYNANEGITKEELANLLRKKAEQYGNLCKYFSISSAQHFINPDISGINEVTDFISVKANEILNKAITSKKIRVIKFYTENLEQILITRNEEIKSELDRIKIILEKDKSRESSTIKEEKEDYEEYINSKCKSIFERIKKYLGNSESSSQGLEQIWDKEFRTLLEFIDGKKEQTNGRCPQLPSIPIYDNIIFERRTSVIDEISDILDLLSPKDDNDESKKKDDKNLFNRFKDDIKKKKISKETREELERIFIDGNNDNNGLLKKMGNYYKYYKALNDFLTSSKAEIDNFNEKALKLLSIDEKLKNIDSKYEEEYNMRSKNINDKLSIKEIKEDIVKLNKLGKALYEN